MNKTKTKMNINSYEIEIVNIGNPMNPVIVFAHGLGGNIDQWTEQIQYFSEQYHVLAFSLQGHGQSSKPNDITAYSLLAYAETVLGLFRELKITSCVWVGNSMGGVIGYEIIRQDPGLITHLITNGTTPALHFPGYAMQLVAFADKVMIKLMGLSGYIRFAVKNATKFPDIQASLYQMMIQTDPLAIIASHQLLARYNYLEELQFSGTPITIIQTPCDMDINRSIQQYKSQLVGVKAVDFREIPGAGHIVNMEKPEIYNTLLAKILA